MNSKVLRKQLLAAVAMVIVAAIAVSSSTFAWFAMSDTVTATGMTVTAKSDAIFLEIKGTQDSNFGLTGTDNVNAELYPTNHETFSALADVSTVGNWYYRYNRNSDNATNDMTAKTTLTSFDNYVAMATYQVQLHEGSASTGYDLYVKDITIPENKGITVVIAGTTGYKEFSASATDITFNAADVISDTVAGGTPQTITAYIFFNGDDANVYTDNVAALTGSVSFVLQAFTTDHT